MPKLESNLYGSDDTGAAQAIATDALDVIAPGTAIADYWGDIQDTTRAQSYANVGRESTGPSTPDTPTKSRAADLEKLPRYKTGKTTTGHSTGQKQSPEFEKASGSRPGPLWGTVSTDGKKES